MYMRAKRREGRRVTERERQRKRVSTLDLNIQIMDSPRSTVDASCRFVDSPIAISATWDMNLPLIVYSQSDSSVYERNREETDREQWHSRTRTSLKSRSLSAVCRALTGRAAVPILFTCVCLCLERRGGNRFRVD